MKFEEILAIYEKPLFTLLAEATAVHKTHHVWGEIQLCYLISFKTGGCQEDCKYCSQSSYYKTEVAPKALLKVEEVIEKARKAIERGATRICIGAAWRAPPNGKAFDKLLEAIGYVKEMGAEVCCTLGMLTEEQLLKLKKAGLFAYNHNIDTSEEYYSTVVTTRSYADRLQTLDLVQKNGVSLCCGGILGMGETRVDRVKMIHTLASREKAPDSIPINLLSPVPGTPFENQPPVPLWEVLRVIATVRILFPQAQIRLGAGRKGRSIEEQTLCFLAGVNSIFIGDVMLTSAVPNPSYDQDEQMFSLLGLKKKCLNF